MSSEAAPEVIVRVDGVSKWYPAAVSKARLLRFLWPTPMQPAAGDFWALRNVSFDIRRGHVVGLIGRNGSGKSTLLQILSGLMAPSSGTVETHGTITPLLELGAGFNPDFTGRENILLSNEIYGTQTDRLRRNLDEILAFAGIGAFIDQPVKTYSSGMFARLAFAVAIETAPDLLIIDEILSVGDLGFQARCFQRIEKLRESGTSILFVSHDMSSVQMICDEVILLDQGEVRMRDKPRVVTDAYIQLVTSAAGKGEKPRPRDGIRDADRLASVENIRLTDAEGREFQTARGGATCRLSYEIEFFADIEHPVYSMQLQTLMGFVVYDQNTLFAGTPVTPVRAGDRRRVSFEFTLTVCPGPFRIGCGVADLREGVPFPIAGGRQIPFEVVSDKRAYGLANLGAEVKVEEGA